jgi:dihydrolipoamide dehydrogenase
MGKRFKAQGSRSRVEDAMMVFKRIERSPNRLISSPSRPQAPPRVSDTVFEAGEVMSSAGTKVTVIGAGPGGYVAAIRAAQSGAEVTLVEQDKVGGNCLHWGCIPSKVMKSAAELMERIRNGPDWGVSAGDAVTIDLKRFMERKRKVVQDQLDGITRILAHQRVHLVSGTALVQGPGLCRVKTAAGGQMELRSDRLILATGSQLLALKGLPFDGKRILSSDDVLQMEEVPKKIVIVGGGAIGCEFACILSAMGASVNIVEAMGRLLPLHAVDEACSKVIQREMKKRKIDFMLDTVVEEVREEGGNLKVKVAPSPAAGAKKGPMAPRVIEADQVLVCVGRRPQIRPPWIEGLNMGMDDRGWVLVDEGMQTTVPGIYAIGDMLGPSRPMLAHVASHEGLVAAENAMGGTRRMTYDAVPSVIFTMPEVASVGLTEKQAREKGHPVRADSCLFRNLGKAQAMGEIAGEAKIISNAENGRILGVHMVGAHASDLIAEGGLAVRLGATVTDLAETIHAHPTLAEVMMETSLKALGRPLHG